MEELIMRVQLNRHGAPDYSTAEPIETKQIKYFDEDEKVWKIGSVVVDE